LEDAEGEQRGDYGFVFLEETPSGEAEGRIRDGVYEVIDSFVEGFGTWWFLCLFFLSFTFFIFFVLFPFIFIFGFFFFLLFIFVISYILFLFFF
jgi:hypothetical protein